jgi:superfamily I DNA/RNA helicase
MTIHNTLCHYLKEEGHHITSTPTTITINQQIHLHIISSTHIHIHNHILKPITTLELAHPNFFTQLNNYIKETQQQNLKAFDPQI